jgi:hypothetical protein
LASSFVDPLALIRQYESSNRYFVGTGGADLSNAALAPSGFPIWDGFHSSHAAGAYQFEPATWDIYAPRLGITDFSKESQDAVAAACYAARGFADWSPYDVPLAAAIKAAGGAAAFSLGAAWLVMAKAQPPPAPTTPMPPPVPDPIPVPTEPPVGSYRLTWKITDDQGRMAVATTIMASMAGAALVGVIAAAMALMVGVAVANGPEGQQQEQPTAQATLPDPFSDESDLAVLRSANGRETMPKVGTSVCLPKGRPGIPDDLRWLLAHACLPSDSGR